MVSQLISTERNLEFINKDTFNFSSSVFPMKNLGDRPFSMYGLFYIYGPSSMMSSARGEETAPSNFNIELKSETYPLLNHVDILNKLEALNGVLGLLSDFSEREMKTFEENIKRRPLFE